MLKIKIRELGCQACGSLNDYEKYEHRCKTCGILAADLLVEPIEVKDGNSEESTDTE